MLKGVKKGKYMQKIKIVKEEGIPYRVVGEILDELQKNQITIYDGKVDNFTYNFNGNKYYIKLKYTTRDTTFTIKKSVG